MTPATERGSVTSTQTGRIVPLAVELVGVGPDLVDEDVAGVHVGAEPRELDRDGAPDAARGAGDDDALTCERDQHGRDQASSSCAVSRSVAITIVDTIAAAIR